MEKEAEQLFLQGKTKEAFPLFQKEGEAGNGRAMYFLGSYYQEGFGGVAIDEKKALQWFKKGQDAGDPLCSLSLLDDTEGPDMWKIVNEDFPEVLKMAVKNDVFAMDEAGRFYLGAGVILNFEEGLKWLSKAALFDYWRALYDLGEAYQEGYVVNQDEARAYLCFQKAAAFHDPRAEYELASCYEEGRGSELNPGKAAEWYTRAWKDGNTDAGYALGLLYSSSDEAEKDDAKAFQWFSRAARAGSGKARAALARFYDQGFGVPKDLHKAEKLYRQAAEAGEEESWFSLALLQLEQGEKEKGFQAMEKAAEAGITQAEYACGMMYLQGEGTGEDTEEGLGWLEKAADQGSEEAEKVLRFYQGL